MAATLRTPEQLTQLFRQRRRDLKVTQDDVARRMGLSQKRLSTLERHPEQLSVRQLLDLTALLDIRLLLDTPSSTLPKNTVTPETPLGC